MASSVYQVRNKEFVNVTGTIASGGGSAPSVTYASERPSTVPAGLPDGGLVIVDDGIGGGGAGGGTFYYDEMPEGGLPTEGVSNGTLAIVDDGNDVFSVESVVEKVQGSLPQPAPSVPVGSVFYFAKNDPPEGYLVCNGGEVSRETYADLFAVVGETFGAGDGSTTFALPYLYDRFPHGSATVGEVKEAGLPNIEAAISGATDSGVCGFFSSPYGAFSVSDPGKTFAVSGTGTRYKRLSFNASTYDAIFGAATTVQPPALTLLPCIKY